MNTDASADFARRRKLSGITQLEFAREAGIAQPGIVDVENERIAITTEQRDAWISLIDKLAAEKQQAERQQKEVTAA